LFGNLGGLNGGLFGNLNSSNTENLKKDSKLFGDTGSNLFSGSSLFQNNSLFSGTSSSLFSSKPLFNFSSINSTTTFVKDKKEEDSDEGEGEGENDLFESNSPNPYNPLEMAKGPKTTEKGPYEKRFLKELENIFVYVKDEGKFVTKGKGFLSLEFAEVDNKKVGVIVFRYEII